MEDLPPRPTESRRGSNQPREKSPKDSPASSRERKPAHSPSASQHRRESVSPVRDASQHGSRAPLSGRTPFGSVPTAASSAAPFGGFTAPSPRRRHSVSSPDPVKARVYAKDSGYSSPDHNGASGGGIPAPKIPSLSRSNTESTSQWQKYTIELELPPGEDHEAALLRAKAAAMGAPYYPVDPAYINMPPPSRRHTSTSQHPLDTSLGGSPPNLYSSSGDFRKAAPLQSPAIPPQSAGYYYSSTTPTSGGGGYYGPSPTHSHYSHNAMPPQPSPSRSHSTRHHSASSSSGGGAGGYSGHSSSGHHIPSGTSPHSSPKLSGGDGFAGMRSPSMSGASGVPGTPGAYYAHQGGGGGASSSHPHHHHHQHSHSGSRGENGAGAYFSPPIANRATF
ncbi:hypothetical protein DFH27DRAFT_580701 [Peziza echinospora]|nr:hypothetical protein DFH27DRAFT_580701 [Peziza echinospora]